MGTPCSRRGAFCPSPSTASLDHNPKRLRDLDASLILLLMRHIPFQCVSPRSWKSRDVGRLNAKLRNARNRKIQTCFEWRSNPSEWVADRPPCRKPRYEARNISPQRSLCISADLKIQHMRCGSHRCYVYPCIVATTAQPDADTRCLDQEFSAPLPNNASSAPLTA